MDESKPVNPQPANHFYIFIKIYAIGYTPALRITMNHQILLYSLLLFKIRIFFFNLKNLNNSKYFSFLTFCLEIRLTYVIFMSFRYYNIAKNVCQTYILHYMIYKEYYVKLCILHFVFIFYFRCL